MGTEVSSQGFLQCSLDVVPLVVPLQSHDHLCRTPPPQFRLQPLHVVLGPLFALQSGRDLQTGTLSHGQMGRILPLVAEETVFWLSKF